METRRSKITDRSNPLLPVPITVVHIEWGEERGAAGEGRPAGIHSHIKKESVREKGPSSYRVGDESWRSLRKRTWTISIGSELNQHTFKVLKRASGRQPGLESVGGKKRRPTHYLRNRT